MSDRIVRLKALDSCTVSDALDRLGLSGCVTGLTAILPGSRIAGRVRTVKIEKGPAPSRAPARHLGAAAIDASEAGEIIVVEQRTGVEAGCWGGVLSEAARAKGIGGVIAEGPIRDVDEARALDFPVFCRSFTALTARGRVHEAASDVPVAIGEALVRPGDYAIADSSAAIFIAPDRIDELLEVAEALARREADMVRQLRAGTGASAVLGAAYEHALRGRE